MKSVVFIIGLALVALGVTTMLAPDIAASGFGIPAETPGARAYLLAAGTRDLALGAWLLAVLWLRVSHRELAASVFAIAIVAAGDAANVLGNGGPASATLVHFGGLVVLVCLGWRLWAAGVPKTSESREG